MTTLYIKPGEALDHLAASAITVNSVVVEGSLIGVAATNIASGAVGAILVDGVFTLPKVSGTAMPKGMRVTWSVSNNAFIVGAGVTGDVFGAGVIAELDAASGDTVARVLINPGMGTAVA